jgi:hypothetical protein
VKSTGYRQTSQKVRYQRVAISPYTTNLIHQINPWVVTWWSLAFPGLGYILLGKSLKGIIFLFWEVLINMESNINTAILYSLTGRFELARQVVDGRWLLLYVSVLIFIMWDSYHLTVDFNKISILAEREKPANKLMAIDSFSINFLRRVNPLLAAGWSAFMPGLGHLYLQRMNIGVLALAIWIPMAVLSRLYEAVRLTALGSFYEATSAVNPQWFLFLPSILCFAVYSSHIDAIEVNKLIRTKQSFYLQQYYQDPDFEMPV